MCVASALEGLRRTPLGGVAHGFAGAFKRPKMGSQGSDSDGDAFSWRWNSLRGVAVRRCAAAVLGYPLGWDAAYHPWRGRAAAAMAARMRNGRL